MSTIKKINSLAILIFLLGACPLTTGAQLLGGFFNQKGTQRKNTIRQIALYRTYLGYLKKGYAISENGLTTIKKIKEGDIQLHADHFNALKKVNPAILRLSQARDILNYSEETGAMITIAAKEYAVSGMCWPTELDYVQGVRDNLLSRIDRNLSELEMIITDDQLQLTDDERLARLDSLLSTAKEQYSFSVSFSGDVHYLIRERRLEQGATNRLKKIYHVP